CRAKSSAACLGPGLIAATRLARRDESLVVDRGLDARQIWKDNRLQLGWIQAGGVGPKPESCRMGFPIQNAQSGSFRPIKRGAIAETQLVGQTGTQIDNRSPLQAQSNNKALDIS